MLQELKNVNLDRVDEEQMVALVTFGEQLAKSYSDLDLVAPEWVEEKLKVLKRELAARQRDNLEKALKEVQARRETLRTAEEKRNDLDAQAAKLQERLAALTK